MKIWQVPIEPLEERYSKQWTEWFEQEFVNLGVEFTTIKGEILSTKIRQGSFLDVIGTNFYKACQLKSLCGLLENGFIKDDDVILLHDGWFPGIEMLAYIRDALDLKFKIYAIFHAGTYDPWDFLTQKGMRKWGKYIERSWLEFIDGIFVASKFHKNLILQGSYETLSFADGSFATLANKIHVTGLPIYPDFVQPDAHKENIIVFPHRLDPEKQPEMFQKLRSELVKRRDFGWIMTNTKTLCTTKQQYYNLLNKAKISVSCALQETWGIAMQESVMCGCIPIVPNRLSYQELYPAVFRYDSYEELIEKVEYFTKTSGEGIESLRLEILKNQFIKMGAEAIPNMVKILKEK